MDIKMFLSKYFNYSNFTNPIKTDIHSHILPSIDDGSKSMKESILMIKEFEKLGYQKLIVTPHVMSDSYPNTQTSILNQLDLVRSELIKENINIEIEASAEYYLDLEFFKLLKNRDILPFKNKFLLFETSYISKPNILEKAIFEILSSGFIPVLAHPERYYYMHNTLDEYIILKELGVLFQLDLMSLLKYKRDTYKVSMWLIKNGLIDFLGSDVHRVNDIQKIQKVINNKEYKKIFKYNNIQNDI